MFGTLGPGGRALTGVAVPPLGPACLPFSGSSEPCVFSLAPAVTPARQRQGGRRATPGNTMREGTIPYGCCSLRASRAWCAECVLEPETWVQMLALSLSPSLQRLKQRPHRSFRNPWSPCVGICRPSSGARRQRTVACACRSRYLPTPQVGQEGLGRGSPRAVGPTQEGFAPTVYGALAASALGLWRDSGTVARVVGPGVAQALPLGALPCSDQVGCLDPEPTT